jgi:hypothetical protein
MMIVVSPQDFKKLSRACQLELISMIGFSVGNAEYPYDSLAVEDEAVADLYIQKPRHPVANDIVGDKQVIDISNEHAQSLIANISGKSLETLKLFAQGEPIDLNELVGTDKLYENFNDLKRSFVGAVNRRLRTVTGNRLAVLFSTVKSKSSEEETKIRVKPRTAAALRRVLDILEPLPEFNFYSIDGYFILKTDANTKTTRGKLHQKLKNGWQSFAGHANQAYACVSPIQIAEHYLSNGFSVKVGSAVAWDDENGEPEYAFSEPIATLEELTAKFTNLNLGDGTEHHNALMALMHPEVAEVLAIIG